MRVEQALHVAAPAPVVWQVITDLARYPEWNPFVRACRSDLAVGSPIDMRVAGLAPFELAQREHILAHEPGRRLCYGLDGAFAGGVSSERCHVVTPLDAATTRYESSFALRGTLAPLVRLLLGRRLAHGFDAMTAALAKRAEALAALGSAAH